MSMRFYMYQGSSWLHCIISPFPSILSFLFRPSCPVLSLLFVFPVSILLSNPPSPAITLLSCSASYSILLSCPVHCFLSCLLLSILSLSARPVSCPVVTPDLFCLRNSIPNIQYKIQSWLSFSSFVNL
jgi:hypothetical protein